MAVNRFISCVKPTPQKQTGEAAAEAGHATLYDFASKNAPAKATDSYTGPDKSGGFENVVGGGRPMASAADIAPPPIKGMRRFS